MLVSRWSLALVPAILLGCTPPRLGSGEIANPQLITEDQIEASRATTAYEVIQKVHANFLSYRGETSLNRSTSRPFPTVYVDGQEYGPISSLSNLSASQIATIRLYRSWEATTKFGTGNMGGVIAITTRQ
ncbi:MAG TPA: TonB-dependent receptor plug domain-containing protein [Gemmatimonadaceae bacterium]|jgi:outer membrane cobalamin receptor|nr:TonB-dependent receptor plug domain-containing protein [Gemmatimonadaceae bacterium]